MRESIFLAAVLMLGSAFAAAEELASIDPWLSRKTGVTDVSLDGEWRRSDDGLGAGCILTFTPHIDSGFVYNVRGCEVNEAEFTAALHRLDGRLLLVVGQDLPAALDLFVPVYLLFKVELGDDTLRMFSIDGESFDWRATGANIEQKNGLVLSPTKDLMSFLAWQVGDPSFFEDEPASTFKRMEGD
jgi:hypothetical protein